MNSSFHIRAAVLAGVSNLLFAGIALGQTGAQSPKQIDDFAKDPATIHQATIGVRYLIECSREPDSFQLGVVYLKPNRKNHPPNICIRYKGKNGFGGYSGGQAVMEYEKGPKYYSGPYDPDNIYGDGRFWLVCDPKKAVDITESVLKELAPTK